MSPNYEQWRETCAEHHHDDEHNRPPAPGDGEEYHAGGGPDNEDRLGRPEGAEDLAPVGQAGRALSGEPVRDRPVAEHVAVPVLGDHDQLADADDGAEDQRPGHQDPGGDAAPVAGGGAVSHGGLRFCWLQVGSGLRLESLGDRTGHRLPGRLAGQLEGEGGDAQPGDAERPAAQHVGDVVHAEQDPADPDQGDQRHDRGGEDTAPRAARGGQEDEQQRPVADDGAERVPAGEAVPVAVRDRMRDHRSQPPDQVLQHRVEHQRARAGDQQVEREPPAPPDRQDHRRGPDDRPEHPAAAQPGDRLDHGDYPGVPGDQGVDPGRGAAVGGFQRRPLQPHQDEQEREDQRRGRDHHEWHEAAAGTGTPTVGEAERDAGRHGSCTAHRAADHTCRRSRWYRAVSPGARRARQ